MPTRPAAAAKPKKVNGKGNSPYGYPFWDWVAREDPEYVRARQPLSALSIGEGKELSVKYREMVIIGSCLRGRRMGACPQRRPASTAPQARALESIQSAACRSAADLSTVVQALMNPTSKAVKRDSRFTSSIAVTVNRLG